MFPHTVTVYNVVSEEDDEFHVTQHSFITVLRGVMVDASKAANARLTGPDSADAVNMYIPFDVEAVDGITGEAKTYAEPFEFDRAEAKTGLWTMSLDGEGQADSFFIRGEVVEPDMSVQALKWRYSELYNITKVDKKDYGRLKHWEVGGA